MIETEAKYRLIAEDFEELKVALQQNFNALDFYKEYNTLYTGANLKPHEVLRIRTISDLYYYLTYKGEPYEIQGIKSRVENELMVDSDPTEFILSLGYKPSVSYEKFREEFEHPDLLDGIIQLDTLPFGHFLEIEGTVDYIKQIEEIISNTGFTLVKEPRSYPEMALIGLRS